MDCNSFTNSLQRNLAKPKGAFQNLVSKVFLSKRRVSKE